MSACGFANRKGASEAIASAVRALPGVAEATVNYQNDFTNGAHFFLHVTLADEATPAQAAAVGTTFVDRMKAADYAHYDVVLDVGYRRVDDLMVNAPSGGFASIRYAFDEDGTVGATGAQVGESLRRWLTIAQYPIVSAVRLEQPLFDARVSAPEGFTVALAPSADDRAVRALIDAQPELLQATWQIVTGPATAAQIYTVRGVFPDQQRRRQWDRIVAALGGEGHAEASTDTVELPKGFPPTTVQISVSSLARDPSAVVRAVAGELSPLGLPVLARFFVDRKALTVTLGGCDTDDKDHTPDPLETELRQSYQRC